MMQHSKERGAVVLFVLVVLTAVLAILAMTADNSRQEVLNKKAQNMADAIALGGATTLDGTSMGWTRAKRNAIAAMAANSIGEAPVPESIAFDTGTRDSMFDNCTSLWCQFQTLKYDTFCNDDWFGETYSGGQCKGDWSLRVRIERGFYEWDENEDKYAFRSLESFNPLDLDENVTRDVTIPGGGLIRDQKVSGLYGVPMWLLGNAVRATVTVQNVPSTFAKIFGVTTLSKVERVSVAVRNQEIEECVAPMAIPLCSLMLDTDPNKPYSNFKYDVTQFNPTAAGERELVFTEAAFDKPWRMEGVTRSRSYPRPPYERNGSGKLNRRALELNGVMGLPDGAMDQILGGVSPLEKVAAFFRNPPPNGCVRAKVGEKFRPIDTFFGAGGGPSAPAVLPDFLNDPNVETAIASYIKGSTRFFRDSFYTDGDPAQSRLPNFPALRHFTPGATDPLQELRLNWPTEFGGPDTACLFGESSSGHCYNSGEVLLTSQPDERLWTNPMCHSKHMDLADYPGAKGSGVGAQARRVRVPVIAPENPYFDQSRSIYDPANGTPYCDWSSVYNASPQHSFEPIAATNPVIVGFVEVDLFDFNIRDLSQPGAHQGTTATTPYYQHTQPGRVLKIMDNSPAAMSPMFQPSNVSSFLSMIGQYIQDNLDTVHVNCMRNCEAGTMVDCANQCFCPQTEVQPPASLQNSWNRYAGCYVTSLRREYSPNDSSPPFGNITDMKVSSKLRGLEPKFCLDPRASGEISSFDGSYSETVPSYAEAFRSLVNLAYVAGIDVRSLVNYALADLSITLGPPASPSSGYQMSELDPVIDAMNQKYTGYATDTEKEAAYGRCQKLLLALDFGNLDPSLGMKQYMPTIVSQTGDENYSQLHCLPMKIDNRYDLFDPTSWEDPQDLQPQYGCGGIRARVSVDTPKGVRTFIAPQGLNATRPAIVETPEE